MCPGFGGCRSVEEAWSKSREAALCELRLNGVLRSWRIEAAEDGSPSREHILTQIDGVAKDVPELVKPRGAGSSGSRQPVLKTEKRLSRDALENMGPDEINSRWDTVRKFLAGKRS
jgi:hypothetical protein